MLPEAREEAKMVGDGFVSRLSLWVSDDMSHHRRFFKPSVKKAITDGSCLEPSVIVYFHSRFGTRTVCDK